MGHVLLIWRLLVRDLRRRPGEAVMFLIAVTAATTSLTVGLAADDAVATSYLKTRAATEGPDITVISTTDDPSGLAGLIADLPGVAAQGEPVFAFHTTVDAGGWSATTSVEGREDEPAAVDRPLVTSGTWVSPGGAVLERGFAQALGVGVGDEVTISGRAYPIVGLAISAATPVYPLSDWAQGPGPTDYGGRIWLTAEDARAAAGDTTGVHLIHVRLDDPGAPGLWRDTVFTPEITGESWIHTHVWQGVLQDDVKLIRGTRPALVVGAWLLAVAAIVTLTALATVRAGRDNRRAGLLKAVGAGPGTVTVVLLAQYLLLTALATGLGLAAGCLVAPGLADPSAGLLTTASPPDGGTALAAAILAAVVSTVGAVAPAVRVARASTVDALTDPAHLVTRHPRLNAMTAHLPTSMLLGVRLLARRPGRAALAVVGTATTGLMVTAMLAFRTELAAAPDHQRFGPVDIRTDSTGETLLGITLVLVALSTLNAVLLGWSTAVQARRTLTVSRTLGATPGQVVSALCVTQLLPAILGTALGIPAGLVLYWLFGTTVTPPTSWMLTAAVTIVLAVTALTALPAWLHTRKPAGHSLNTDLA
ncbi:ABC transporter permease [Streptomyces sp. RFCAC02]|uniref:ABC transporter permease n=1 Tax=Streptomyces sp. RFCAC02 TaxID=2499143 RepID=UPI00101F9425|nr:ABC transporter permease [Streptomyces sp. RFCAC02]